MKTIITLYVLGWVAFFVLRSYLSRVLSDEDKVVVNELMVQIIRDPLGIGLTKREPDASQDES